MEVIDAHEQVARKHEFFQRNENRKLHLIDLTSVLLLINRS